MQLLQSDLITILEQSSSLSERLGGRFVGVRADAASAGRLARWKQVVAPGDPRRFQEILSALNIRMRDDDALLALLGTVQQSPDTPLPPWTTLLHEIVESVATAFARREPGEVNLRTADRMLRRVPFGHLYFPIAEYARSRVLDATPSVGPLFEKKAWEGLQHHLLRRIAAIASSTLQTAYLVHQSFRGSGMMAHLFKPPEFVEPASEHQPVYRSFVEAEGQDGLFPFFRRHPVAARLISEVTSFWIEFVQEFLRHFEADRAELSALFNGGHPLARVSAIEAGISDPHHRGRSVLIVTFRGGLRLVYKPRSLEIDGVYYDLIEQLNASAITPKLHRLKFLDRGQYGWSEFAPHSVCANRSAARRFYRRAGSLACLIHWLSGIDCHRENLIAMGEHPILIDLESLAHPLGSAEELYALERSPWNLATSVLRSGFLPLWQPRFMQQGVYDNSALGGPSTQLSAMSTIRWQHINTDRMRWTMGKRRETYNRHRPKINNATPSLNGFESDVLAGYRHMVEVLGSPAAPLSQSLQRAWKTTRRRIKRPTVLYAMLLQRSLQPECLASGVDRSIDLSALPCEVGDEKEWKSELESLERLDIPYLHVSDRAAPEHLLTGQITGQEELVRCSLQRNLVLEEGRIAKRSDHPK